MSSNGHQRTMLKLVLENVNKLFRFFLHYGKTDSLQGAPQESVFLGLYNRENAFLTAGLRKKGGEQSALYIFSCNAAGHGKLCKDHGAVFNAVLTEADDAVVAEIVRAGQCETVVSIQC